MGLSLQNSPLLSIKSGLFILLSMFGHINFGCSKQHLIRSLDHSYFTKSNIPEAYNLYRVLIVIRMTIRLKMHFPGMFFSSWIFEWENYPLKNTLAHVTTLSHVKCFLPYSITAKC